MSLNVDPYRRYKPIRLGIHVCAADDTGEPVKVRNYDLPSLDLARLRFDAARRACEQPADEEVTVELISGGSILDSFPMRRAALPSLSAIIHPPPPPEPDRGR
jgi:hypothetical protein